MMGRGSGGDGDERPRHVLWGLGYSPWTEQARWSLDHHGLAYTYREHTPMLGERQLRRRASSAAGGGPVSVPLLIAGTQRVGDTLAIADYADQHGAASPLLPAGARAEVTRLHGLADRGKQAGRALVIAAMRHDPRARSESLQGVVPKPLRGVMRPVANRGMEFLARKYGVDGSSAAEHETELVRALDEIRATLEDREYLLGTFTYADITASVLLQMVQPRPVLSSRLGPATTRAWTRCRLAEEYADLLEWRDRIYRCHRFQGVRGGEAAGAGPNA